eukprot:TRINITY_DN426_c0_g1_i1.p1 TRINITY_DN426_c0_g1~~TRINITY_DN426_c0_g1_i1.p1  ORF type:complete len:173 (-),score=67.01 TRINITY_DN426_c0_g1_i1:144-662(-)
MFKLVFVLAVAAAAPLEDTPEVAAAKAEFQAAFDAAVAGEHAALAPVNNDIQAEQIAVAYLDDIEEVAAAKASFKAAFDDAAAGGLAAKQEAAPVHVIAEPEPLAVVAAAPVAPVVHALPLGYPYGLHYGAYPYGAYPYGAFHGALPYGLPAFGLNALPYNGLPVVAAAAAE